MVKKIQTYILVNMLDARMNSCMGKMTNALKDQDGKLMVDNSNSYYIIWDGGHFSFDTFNLMKDLKSRLKEQDEIDVNEDTFTLSELTQLLKACDHAEVRSYLVDCLVAKMSK